MTTPQEEPQHDIDQNKETEAPPESEREIKIPGSLARRIGINADAPPEGDLEMAEAATAVEGAAAFMIGSTLAASAQLFGEAPTRAALGKLAEIASTDDGWREMVPVAEPTPDD